MATPGRADRSTGRQVARDGRGHARTLASRPRRGHPPVRPIEPRHSAATGRVAGRRGPRPGSVAGRPGLGYTPPLISTLHTRYALKPTRCDLVVGLVADRRGPARPAHRHRAARPEGAGARRVRRDVDLAEPAARLPDRAGPRRGPDGRGHRRQPLPRLRGRHRGQLDRPLASAGRGRDQGAGRRADPLLARRDFYLPIYPEVCRELAGIAPIVGPRRGPTSATPAPRSSRRRSSSPASRRKRPYIVAFLGAFHGRTYGSVSLTASKAKYHAGFGPLLPGVFHAPYGRVEDLRWFDEVLFDKLAPANEVAAIIVEPIQGEGGYIVPEDGFLQGLRDICDEHGILLDRRRDPVGRRADRQDVGGRALGRRARHPADGQGHRVGHAARRDGRPGRAARDAGARARTARPTAATRSPAPRRSRRSSCSRAASSTTPRSAASRRWPGSGRSSTRYAGLVTRRPRQGPDARRRVRHRRARRGGPVGLLRARPARPRVRQDRASGCRRR